VTLLAWDKIVPRPRPGKMYILLPCPGVYFLPLYVVSGKGEPEANRTAPSVHLMASSKLHSDFSLGLLSATTSAQSRMGYTKNDGMLVKRCHFLEDAFGK
jgi:hypothetical protein